jgi:hypothetical protein
LICQVGFVSKPTIHTQPHINQRSASAAQPY